ncbi:hypothetical protein TNCV_1038061 [Trichonephila clavipes]|nr:hypothetical protein TNCV_1038061 [Trichonephila clavipes]
MTESLVLSEEKKMPAVCDCDEASLMTPNSWIPSCEKCWIQVSPVPASDEVCPPVFSELPVMRCVPVCPLQILRGVFSLRLFSGQQLSIDFVCKMF